MHGDRRTLAHREWREIDDMLKVWGSKKRKTIQRLSVNDHLYLLNTKHS